MSTEAGFQLLQSVVVVPYTLVTEGNLSIQSGRGDGVRDNTIIREGGDSGSDPVVSGSSVKGMLRSTIEAVLASAHPGKVCVPAVCLGRDRTIPEGRKDDCGRRSSDDPCPVCRMFGNTAQAGRAVFHDGHLVEGQNVFTFDRSHVALRRDTKTAAGGALVTMETLPTQVTFKGDVVLINPEDWMVGAIVETLPLLKELGLGAKKTSGYGEVKVEVGDPEFRLLTGGAQKKPRAHYVAEWRKLAKLQTPASE